MECLGQYTPADAQLELEGFLEDKNYIDNLPPDHFINKGENVFAFSLGAAAMEMQQFLSLVLKPRGISNSPKEYDFVLGDIDTDFPNSCTKYCLFPSFLAKGDGVNNDIPEKHEVAERSRVKALFMKMEK